jgi:hypothetical protein
MVSTLSLSILGLLAAISAPASAEDDYRELNERPELDQRGQEESNRVVDEAWLTLTDMSPRSLVKDIEQQVLQAGGEEVDRSVSKTDDYVEIDVTWHVPVDEWPKLRTWLIDLPRSDFETQRLSPDEVEGKGPRVVAVSASVSSPLAPEPLLQFGPSIGLAAPIAGDGLGLARPIGARVLFERDFSMDAAYAAPLGEDPWMLTVTMGAATCSELLGGCERTTFNPFVGARVGYAWRGESWALLQAEAGLELVHLGGFIWEVSARPTVALQKGHTALGVDASTAVLMPF